MSTFYFHLRRGHAIYEDHEGFDAVNIDEAVRHATEDALVILRDEPEIPATSQWIEIADASGNTLRTVPFKTVIH